MRSAVFGLLVLGVPSAWAMDVQTYDPQWRQKADITAVRAWEKSNCPEGNCLNVARQQGMDAWRGLLSGMHYANVEILRRRYSISQSIIDDVLKEQFSKPLEPEQREDPERQNDDGNPTPNPTTNPGQNPSQTPPNEGLKKPRTKSPYKAPAGTGIRSTGDDPEKGADKEGADGEEKDKEGEMAPAIPSALGGGGAGAIAGKAQGLAGGFTAGAGPSSDGGFDPGRRAPSMGSLRPGSAAPAAHAGSPGGSGGPAAAMGGSSAYPGSPNPSGSSRRLASARLPGEGGGGGAGAAAPAAAYPGDPPVGQRGLPPSGNGGTYGAGGASAGQEAGSGFPAMRPMGGLGAGAPGRAAKPKGSEGLSAEEEAELDDFIGLLDAAAKTGDFNTRAADANLDRTMALGEPTRAGAVVRSQARSILDKTGRPLTSREKQETAFMASSLGLQTTPTGEKRLVKAVQDAEPSKYRGDRELSWWRRILLWLKRFFARLMG